MLPIQTLTTALKFVSAASGVKDVRYYLNGVLFAFEGDKLHLVATCGAKLHMVTLQLPPAAPVCTGPHIVDTASIKLLLRTFGKSAGDVTLGFDAKGKLCSATAASITLPLALLDGVYPDWRRVLPSPDRFNAHVPSLDAARLATSLKALEPMCGKFKGLAPVEMNGSPNDVGIRPRTIAVPHVTECLVLLTRVNS